MRSLLIPLVSLLTTFSASAQVTFPGPSGTPMDGIEEIARVLPLLQGPRVGKYVGVVTITKDFIGEGLSSKVTLKAYANVKDSGEVTILSVVPESPKAAADNPESTLSRAVPVLDGSNTYTVDGKHRATLTLSAGSFQLTLTSPALGEPDQGTGPMGAEPVDAVSLIIPAAMTRIHYQFYPQIQPRTPRVR